MPIEALSPATARAIGSTSVISDPCSVVKELIDNALDADSSSLVVEISPNTVDVIQVKDNGYGIPTEDHPNVCRHTYTSKIQTLEDLDNVGGSSFGFRGEALASVAEMSGGITVTTRTATEVTGLCLKYEKDGHLSQSQRTSHPVGTTVRIVHFLKHIPVRRQLVLKNAAKILTKIKKLLQAYAIAQPSRRFSLKVLKAKNENNNWTYAPSTGATLSDAAGQIFGREISSCCVIKEISPGTSASESEPKRNGYEVLAFLPKADSDISKLNSCGQFISVDDRPLSATLGIGQNIAKLFKSYIRASFSKGEAPKSISDPFLCLQLRCPRGSYDVNIEPGKDDVLFEDHKIVIALVESMFKGHYGPIADSCSKSPVQGKPCRVHKSDRFGLMLARNEVQTTAVKSTATSDLPVQSELTLPLTQGAPRLEASPVQTPFRVVSRTSREVGKCTAARTGSPSLNPWSATRMNSSLRTPRRDIVPWPISSEAASSESSPASIRRNDSCRNNQILLQESPELISPPISRLVSTSPVTRRRQSQAQWSQVSPTQTLSTNDCRKTARQRDKERYGNGALDTWFAKTTQVSLAEDSLEQTVEQEQIIPTISQLAQERFGTQAGRLDRITEVHSPDSRHGAKSGQSPRPSKQDQSTTDTGHQGSMDSGRGFPVLERWAASLREGFTPETLSEIDKALDFEKRKKEAIQKHRARPTSNNTPSSSQVSASSSHSPHHSRFLKAKAALASNRSFSTDSGSGNSLSPHDPNSLSPNDPRAYLIRQNARIVSKDDSKTCPVPNNKLPFERIPEGYDVHSLGSLMPMDLSFVEKSFRLMALHDYYIHDTAEETLTASAIESLTPLWNKRLNGIVNMRYKSQISDLEINAPVFIDHLKQFDSS
ncbi:Ribosomal protein S5 domain 2-type fold subgroup [Penicillium verhagenii]|uniref:Ribosomal protein S5 domain 2-type fold subgroup n=1 Tax=Penicillium verhagenii TaxID=1562060 RepID=UPI0025459910|nr:Ribosomal protein S5 domain 2-type fold subgroup [Penicillium verhagenii]KAJ5917254.1 Ribosomal protein S5 domain 2-type fold subgroup [Penicillium verhagenii]